MERIRIIKRNRNKGSGIIWGILIVVILLGATAWLLMDRDIIDREQISLSRNTDEDESSDRYNDSDETETFEHERSPDENQENSGNEVIKSYVSFVNREVIPADSIEFQMKLEAVALLQKALNEIEEGSDFTHRNNYGTGDLSDSKTDTNDVTGINPASSKETKIPGSSFMAP